MPEEQHLLLQLVLVLVVLVAAEVLEKTLPELQQVQVPMVEQVRLEQSFFITNS
jgi:hypothetical protein